MGTVKMDVPYLIGPKPGYYWQPTKSIRALGFEAQALGLDAVAAAARAKALNAEVKAERWRRANAAAIDAGSYDGTFRHLADVYRGNPNRAIPATEEWEGLAPSTQDDYSANIERILTLWGDQPVAAVTLEAARELRDGIEDRPYAANYLLRVLRLLLNHAVARPSLFHLAFNPAKSVKLFGKKKGVTARRRHWDDAAETLFLDAAREADWEVFVGYHLLVYTGQRLGDVLAMLVSDDNGAKIQVIEQQKTGARVDIPKHQALAGVLSEHRERRNLAGRIGGTILQTSANLAFNIRYFSERWDAVVDGLASPILDGLQRRDLRRTSVVRLAEAGCTVPQIGSITGHSLKQIESILQTYWVRTYPQAQAAIKLLEAYRPGGQKPNEVGK